MHQRSVHVRIIVRQHVAFHLRESTRNLHSRGAAAHNHHIEQLLTLLLRGTCQRAFKIAQQRVTQSHSLRDGLHRHCLIGYIAVSEKVACSAGGKDKIVILHLSDRRLYDFLLRKDGTHLCHTEIEVVLTTEYLSERKRYLPGLDARRGNLIYQRRELMVVVSVHQNHLHAGIAQLRSEAETAESSSDNHNTLFLISLNIDTHST